jgi:sugar/nucleoside kinase (ribokinase family)
MSGVVVDLVYRIDQVPPPGGDASVESCMITAGGGFNAMVAAKRAGMEVVYGGAHGSGVFADIVRRELADAGISRLQPQSAAADQGSCVVLVDRQGERTFISKHGADGILDAGRLEAIDPAQFDWILLSGFALTHAGSRDLLHAWLGELPDGTRLLFDPSPAVAAIPAPQLARALAKASWISANLGEAAVLTGQTSAEAALAALAARHMPAAGGLVVRCGAAGCWLAQEAAAPLHVPGFAIDTIDTNGAGDTHVGAFVAALSRGADPREAARYANAAAALSTTAFGPATAPSDAETRDFLNRRAKAGASRRETQAIAH